MEKWINQTLTTGLGVMFHSLLTEELHQTKQVDKERNISPKTVVSVWFIHFSTFFLSSCQKHQNLTFLHTHTHTHIHKHTHTHTHTHTHIYVYIYICMYCTNIIR